VLEVVSQDHPTEGQLVPLVYSDVFPFDLSKIYIKYIVKYS